MELISVPIIMAIVYGIIEAIKLPFKHNEKFASFIPLIAGLIGIILGITAYYTVPEIITTHNVMYAILIGLCSGLSATGCNQVVKQMTNYVTDKKEHQVAEQNKTDDKTN